MGRNALKLHAETSTCHLKAKTVSMPNFIFAACIWTTWIKSWKERERESREKHGGVERGGEVEVRGEEEWPDVVYISRPLTRLRGQAANRTRGESTSCSLSLSAPLALAQWTPPSFPSSHYPPLLSSPLLPRPLQTRAEQSATFPPPHTYFHNTCLSLFVLKATDIVFFSSSFDYDYLLISLWYKSNLNRAMCWIKGGSSLGWRRGGQGRGGEGVTAEGKMEGEVFVFRDSGWRRRQGFAGGGRGGGSGVGDGGGGAGRTEEDVGWRRQSE